jgi:TonB family protein
MNRLQKKCILVSGGFHLSLVLILLFGAAFLSSDNATKDVPIIDFIPLKTIDDARSGGGNPRAQPPAAQPPAPQPPTPQPPAQPSQPVTQPEPQKDTVPDPDKAESKPARHHTIDVNTTLVRSDPNVIAAKRAQDDRRRAAAAALSSAANGLKSSLSPSTTIELRGPGGGGVPYANFLSAVKSIYTDAWLAPVGVDDDSATTTTSITIARDGRVISATIIRFSGNSAVDQSVQATLDRVRIAVPLPDDAKEDQRTVIINFNLKAKLTG